MYAVWLQAVGIQGGSIRQQGGLSRDGAHADIPFSQRADYRSPPVFPCGYLSYRNGNASRRWRKVCRKLETKKRLIYAYHRLLAPSSNTPASYTVFNTINRKTRGRYANSIATNTSFFIPATISDFISPALFSFSLDLGRELGCAWF